MRLCAVESLEDGAILGKSLYEINGKLMLGAGYRITADMKKMLRSRAYTHLYIMEEGTEDIIPEDVISDEVRILAISKLTGTMCEIEKRNKFRELSSVKSSELIRKGYLRDIDASFAFRSVVDEILKDISAAGADFMNMVMIKTEDSYFMDHALNTTVLAILVGKRYKFSREELKALALGTFLHDIGKVILAQMQGSGTTNKIGEFYREHPTFGYLLLANSASPLLPMELQIVNQHHEYQNGSGFPIGLSGKNLAPIQMDDRVTKGSIYRLAEICAVVNAFDNLVFNPLSTERLDPGQALKRIMKKAGTLYNKNVVQTLLKVVPGFPVGAMVRIQNAIDPLLIGYLGVVGKINENNLNRPSIVLIRDKFNKKIKPVVIDTSKYSRIELEILL